MPRKTAPRHTFSVILVTPPWELVGEEMPREYVLSVYDVYDWARAVFDGIVNNMTGFSSFDEIRIDERVEGEERAETLCRYNVAEENLEEVE